MLAQPLLPSHKSYLVSQQSIRSALLDSVHSTACLGRGRAQQHHVTFPEMHVRLITASPTADAVAAYTDHHVTMVHLQDQAVRWEACCEGVGLSISQSHTDWSPDSSMLMVKPASGRTCQILAASDGALLATSQQSSHIVCLAWHPHSSRLAMVLDSGQLSILKPGDAQTLGNSGLDLADTDQQWVRRLLSWAPTGEMLVHCTQNVVHFCTSAGAGLAEVDFGMYAAIGDCAWSSTSDLLAVSFLQDSAGILMYDTGAQLVRTMTMNSPCARLAWAGPHLAAQCDSYVRILSTADRDFGQELHCFPDQVKYFTKPAWHISGRYLAISCADESIKVLDAESGRTVWSWCSCATQPFSHHHHPQLSPTWSASGQELFYYALPFGKLVAFR